jgi:hypothetical protein
MDTDVSIVAGGPATTRRGDRQAVPRPLVSRRTLQVLLGAVWLVDGALQLQPFMFTKGFVTSVLLPNAAGNPGFVARPIVDVARALEPHIAVWNVGFALVQLGIGVGLLVPRTVRPALVASIAWSAAVWWFGEGFGGLLTGSASLVTGAPGAVLLYALLAVAAWPGADGSASATARPAGVRALAAAVWLGGAALMLEPANRAPGALAGLVRGAAAGEPRWLAEVLDRVAAWLVRAGSPADVVLAVAMALVGVGLLVPRVRRVAILAAVALALAIWVLGEAFGGVLSGQGTDPNSGPLLVVLALAAWERRPAGARAEIALRRVSSLGLPHATRRLSPGPVRQPA